MKLTIEVEDLKILIDGLNNAIFAYNEVVNAIELCCDVPVKMAVLKKVPVENLRGRQKILKDVYMQLVEIEKTKQVNFKERNQNEHDK